MFRFRGIEKGKYLSVFNEMIANGYLVGNYTDSKWIGFSGIKQFGIDYAMNEHEYAIRFGKEFGIPYSTMQDMLRCYALYILGSFIFPTINQKVMHIKSFLTSYGDKRRVFTADAVEAIRDFLLYIGTPEAVVVDIQSRFHVVPTKSAKTRELAHLINYLSIANEVFDLYHGKNELRIEIKEQTVQFCPAAKCGRVSTIWQQRDLIWRLSGIHQRMEIRHQKR